MDVGTCCRHHLGGRRRIWTIAVSAKGRLKRPVEQGEDLESFLERPAIANSARIATAGFMAAFIALLVIAIS